MPFVERGKGLRDANTKHKDVSDGMGMTNVIFSSRESQHTSQELAGETALARRIYWFPWASLRCAIRRNGPGKACAGRYQQNPPLGVCAAAVN